MEKPRIAVLAEHDNQTLKQSILSTLTAAKLLAGEGESTITVFVIGSQCSEVAEEVSGLKEVDRVCVLEASYYEQGSVENIAFALQGLGKTFDYLLGPATSYGKNIMPRVAALLGVAQVSDIVGIVSGDTFVRPIYAGNAIETIQMLDPIKILTIRTTAFTPTARKESTKAPIENLVPQLNLKLSSFVRNEVVPSLGPELTSATIVIAGGRGLQSTENFKKLAEIANKLGGALGASRAAVDAGFVSNEYQVGQTGKVVAPILYIAIGISGAIQHIAGMKDSKVIVAINKDPDAPIFQIADYGLVGDLLQILPELSQELSLRKINLSK